MALVYSHMCIAFKESHATKYQVIVNLRKRIVPSETTPLGSLRAIPTVLFPGYHGVASLKQSPKPSVAGQKVTCRGMSPVDT